MISSQSMVNVLLSSDDCRDIREYVQQIIKRLGIKLWNSLEMPSQTCLGMLRTSVMQFLENQIVIRKNPLNSMRFIRMVIGSREICSPILFLHSINN